MIDRVAVCYWLVDRRAPDQVVHTLPALVGQRIVGIALGYEDVSDHAAFERLSAVVTIDHASAWSKLRRKLWVMPGPTF